MQKLPLKWMGLCAAVLMAGCSSLQQPSTAPGTTPEVAAPAPPPAIGASTAPAGDICKPQGAQWAVGKEPTIRVTEEARVRAGARMARVLRPGQMVTKELDQQRLNLDVDASGKIVAARCG